MLRFAVTSAMAVFVSGTQRVEVETHADGFDAHMARVRAKGWQQLEAHPNMGAAPPQTLELLLAVTQSNTEQLEQTLLAVSEPSNSRYGEHLTMEEVDALVAPASASVIAVTAWLAAHDIEATRVTSNGDFLSAIVSVEAAEALLNTSYAQFYHNATGTAVTRGSTPYSIPEHLAAHIDFVSPTITFPPVHNRPKRSAAVGVTKKFKVTPAFLRSLYSMTDSDVGKGAASNNSQAVASFIGQYYDPKDLKLFWAKYAPAAATPFTDVPKLQSHVAQVEASIDSEYIAATGAGISTQMWYTAGAQPGNSENEPFIKWLTNVASTATVPSVFSISYGDEETGVTEAYAVRTSTEFQKAGARGITLLAASGDSGAGCAAGAYVPTFPASSPWITGVGGLGGGTPGKSPTGEVAAPISGGGFSNYFKRPAFQDDAVLAYQKNPFLPAKKMWNAAGAGFPDISAQALQFDTCSSGFFYPYDGTSCATPTVAGIFAMLNEARVGQGKAPLGYLNPFLYNTTAGKGFNDCTSGNNNYCDDPSGFPATKGWDAVTGWGSPDFAKLKAMVLLLP